MILLIVTAISIFVNVLLAFAVFRLSRRLLEFDDLFELLTYDIQVNMKYFQKLLTTPLFEASQEVRTANNNMFTMAQRLEEFVNRMEETTGRTLRKPDPEQERLNNPPVVV